MKVVDERFIRVNKCYYLILKLGTQIGKYPVGYLKSGQHTHITNLTMHMKAND